MFFLGEVGRKVDGFAAGGFNGAAECEAADLACGGNVALQQGRRKSADGYIIEAVAGVVARQQGGNVYVEREEVSDHVLVFGAVEAAERVGAPRVGLDGGGPIQGCFEP